MSRAGDVTLDWGGDPERRFRLGLGEIKKLQEACDAGPTGIATRCALSLAAIRAMTTKDFPTLAHLGHAKLAEKAEVREVHLQGLLGAGVPGPEALKLVRDWVEERPLGETLLSAYNICMAAVLGADDETLGEQTGEGENPSPTENSDSPSTTASEPSSG